MKKSVFMFVLGQYLRKIFMDADAAIAYFKSYKKIKINFFRRPGLINNIMQKFFY